MIVRQINKVADCSRPGPDLHVTNRWLSRLDTLHPVAEMIGTVIEPNRIFRKEFFGNLIAGARVISFWLSIERQLELPAINVKFAFVPEESNAVATNVDDFDSICVTKTRAALRAGFFGGDELRPPAVLHSHPPFPHTQTIRAPLPHHPPPPL